MKTSRQFARELLKLHDRPIVFKTAFSPENEDWWLPVCVRLVTMNTPEGEVQCWEITEEVFTERVTKKSKP